MRYLYGLTLLCMARSENGIDNYNAISSLEPRSSYSASERLDNQISHLIYKLPGLISTARDTIESDASGKELRFKLYGGSIIFASFKEITADWIINGRSLANFGGRDTIYSYGFLFFYGVGFGLATVWTAPPASELGCGPYDFKQILNDYGFQDGLSSYLHGYHESLGLSSRICEFEIVLRMKLNCVLSQEDNFQEAAEVAFAVEELIEAMKIRLDWEMKY